MYRLCWKEPGGWRNGIRSRELYGSLLATTQAGMTRFAASFGPAGSRLYMLRHDAEPLTAPDTVPDLTRRIAAYIGPVCSFQRTDPNVLTLDVCAYRLEHGAWSEPVPVWQAQQAIREQLGMRPVYYNGLPQRYKWINAPHPKDGTPVAFRFTFEVRDVPQGRSTWRWNMPPTV